MVVAATVLACGLASLALAYRVAYEAQWQALRSELSQLSASAASQLDGDLHRRLVDPSQRGSAEHLQALAPLVAFHAATRDLLFVYTAVLHDGHPAFVLDTSFVRPAPGDDLPPDQIMESYTGHDEDLRASLAEERAVVNERPVAENGTAYVSGYAPFFDRAGGFVGVVGVDMRVDAVEARLAPLRRAMAGLGIVAFALSVGVGAVVLRARRTAAAALDRDRAASKVIAEARDAALSHAREAEAATRAKDAFLAATTHELRNPLSAIIGYTDLLIEDAQSTGLETMILDLRRVRGAAQHLSGVVNDILDYGRIEAGRVELSPTPVDLRRLVDEALALLANPAQAKAVALGATIDADVPSTVVTDPLRLRQVLVNLVANAVKFTERGSVSVRVSTVYSATASYLSFAVTDTGIGIDPDRVSALFERFVQADASISQRFGGTGLGLAVSKGLVELLGGAIDVESEPGRGSTFRFTIPAVRATVESPVAVTARSS
ncbi:MAG: ATP-binding protein [Vicinamibacterales bacterium]